MEFDGNSLKFLKHISFPYLKTIHPQKDIIFGNEFLYLLIFLLSGEKSIQLQF